MVVMQLIVLALYLVLGAALIFFIYTAWKNTSIRKEQSALLKETNSILKEIAAKLSK